MTNHTVVIAGGGPTGLMLAGELALAGVDALIVERRAGQHLDGVRAGGLHARTIEMLDQRGIAGRFLDAGRPMQITGFVGIPLDISDFPTRHPHGLALRQQEIERLLAEWVAGLGVPTLWEREVTGFIQHTDGVDVELSDGSTLRTEYLVGCDGGRSTVRRTAGIDFPGSDATTNWILAEVEMDGEPPVGMRPEGGGLGPVDPDTPGGPYRVVLRERPNEAAADPSLDDVRGALRAAYGSDFGAHSPTWLSRFTDATRQAATYRSGRVLLAGDAAHVHPPQGGQGLNLGVQDAANLGWKLALVVRGIAPETLLDTYHAERHPVGARVLQSTMAQVALSSADDGHRSLHAMVGELLAMDEPRRHVAGMLSGLDIRYDLGGDHPLVGRRMPDIDLVTTTGSTTAYELLRDARPVMLVFDGTIDGLEGWPVRVVVAEPVSDWELPVVGSVEPAPAVLVRPDGYVAWVGEVTDPGLSAALGAWFGPRVAKRNHV